MQSYDTGERSSSALDESSEHLADVGDIFDDGCEVFVWVEIADDEDLGVEFVVGCAGSA